MAQSQTTRRQALEISAGVGIALLGKPLFADDATVEDPPEPLYLHWMVPPFNGSDGNAEQPARRLVSTLVALSQDFDIATGDHEVRIRGRIEPRGEHFAVDLRATYATGTMFFEGAVETERIFDSYGGLFASAVLPTRCALSRSGDCSGFLKQLSEGYLEYRPERSADE